MQSPYGDPVYFAGLVRTDAITTSSLTTAVAVPVSDSSVRIIKLAASGNTCPPAADANASGVPLIIGSAGAWSAGENSRGVDNNVLFAKYEVPASQVNAANAVTPLTIVGRMGDSNVRVWSLLTL